jgi:hypothetical protein
MLGLVVLGLSAAAPTRTAVTVTQTQLKPEPSFQARALTILPAQKTLQVLGRKGGWYRVRDGRTEGWLPMLALRFVSRTNNTDMGIGSLMSTLTSGPRTVTASTGVRGLSVEELRAAQPDWKALARLETFAVSPAEARARAHRQGRKTVEVKLQGGEHHD